MPDDVELSPPSLPASRGRGRPRLITAESPQERIARLQAELREAQEAQKVAEQHAAAIVGSVVIAHARTDENFRRQLVGVLRSDVKSKADVAAIATLVAELESPPPLRHK